MPTLSKKFTHTCETYTLTTVYVYNHLKSRAGIGNVYKEASQFFFEDLRSLLEQTGMDVRFSDTYTYDNTTDCPYFEMFGLQFPVLVHMDCQNYLEINHQSYGSYPAHYYSMVPHITRTGSPSVTMGPKNIATHQWAHDRNYLGCNHQASLCISFLEKQSLEYTINLTYNDNWIIASYFTTSGLKFPIFCLIKGKDINNNQVVYMSATPNACYANRGLSGTSAASYHQLIWTDDWYNNKYNNVFRVPAADANCTYSSYPNYNGNMFLKLSGAETIANIVVPDNKIQLMEPICCGNRVFFDNMYVCPDTVNVDAYYTINNELYYCPGDYTVQMDVQYNAATMVTHACRFLLKMESTT